MNLFLTALSLLNVFAAERPPIPCEHLLFIDPTGIELSSAGTIIGQTDTEYLATLPDEKYIYMIDNQERIIVSPRVPNLAVDIDATDSKFLATHRSLYAKLRQEAAGADVAVTAVGEFIIINGRVTEVNNRSGGWRGTQENLDYAMSYLASRGLKVEPNTRIVDYSVNPKSIDRHSTEAQRATYLIRYHAEPNYIYFIATYKKLAERFPDDAAPGQVDVSKVRKFLIDREILATHRGEFMYATQILSLMQRESAPFVYHTLQRLQRFPAGTFGSFFEMVLQLP